MSLGPEQLSQLQAQRDNFQRDIDKSYIRNEQAEQEVMRNLNEWRRNFANLSIALGAAIIPLTFFTEKEPNYPATFFSAVLLLIVNGLQIYYWQQLEYARETALAPTQSGDSILLAQRLKNYLNKELFLKDGTNLARYKTATTESVAQMVRKQPGKITYRLGFTDDISMFLLALALSFLGAELWVYNIWAYVTPIVSLLAILTIITMYYTFKHQGIVKARVDILQKIQDERREYETWWVEEGPGRSQ